MTEDEDLLPAAAPKSPFALSDPAQPLQSTQDKGPPGSSREGKTHIGAYLRPAFRKNLRMVQAQTDKDIQQLLAEALNDLFRKYGIQMTDQP